MRIYRSLYFTLIFYILIGTGTASGQWINANPPGPDYCSPQSVTYTYNPGNPGNTINWYVDEYSTYGTNGIPNTFSLGTGTSITIPPFGYGAGIRIRVEETDMNGMFVWSANAFSVTYGNYKIPVYYESQGCGLLDVAQPFDAWLVPGRWAMWYCDGIATGWSQGYLEGPLPVGTYVYKLKLGCTTDTLYSDPVSVTTPIPPAVITSTGPTTFCNGDSVALTVQSGTGISGWRKNGTMIPNTNGLITYYAKTSGNYSAQIASWVGTSYCYQLSNEIPVTVNPAAIITGPVNACGGDTVTLSCTSANSYTWSRNGAVIPGANSQTLKVTQGGNYKVTTTGLTCNTSKIHNVKFYAMPSAISISSQGPASLCKNEAMTLSVTGNNITSWNWLRNNTSMPGGTTSSITVTKPGNYKCVVSNAIGCSKTTGISQITTPVANDLPSKSVTIKPGPNGSDSYTTCATGLFGSNYANTTNLEVSAWYKHFRTAERSYLKFNLSTVPAGAPIVSATLKLYADTAIVTQNGLQSLIAERITGSWQENTINWNNAPASTLFQQSSIPVTAAMSNSIISMNVSDIIRHWSFKPTENKGLFLHMNEIVTGGPVKTGWMSFYSGDHADATKRPKLVVKYSYADINASGPLTFCAGGSVTFSTNPGYSYKWYKNNNLIAGATSVNYTATTAGNYYVEISNSAGCSVKSETKTVTIPCREGVVSDDDIIIINEENNPEITIMLPYNEGILSIYDMSGRLISTFNCDEKECLVLKTGLTQGIYLVHVVSGDKIKSERFIVR